VALDDFARRFDQGGAQGEIRLYDRSDVMQALEAVQPGAWDAFIGQRDGAGAAQSLARCAHDRAPS